MTVEKGKLLEEIGKYNIDDLYKEYVLPNYQNPNYEPQLRILLEDRIVPLRVLEVDPITELWKKYDWARTLITENIDTMISEFDHHKLSTIVTLSMSEMSQFTQLCKTIFHTNSIEKRVLLIDVLLDLGFPASEELVINPLYQKEKNETSSRKMEKNSIFDILEYRLDDPDVQEILLKNYEKLFESAIHEKMQILLSVLNYFPDIESPLIEKYGLLLSYFSEIPSENMKQADEIMSTMIDGKQEQELLTELRNRFHQDELVITDSGSYSIVLGTKEWVLKIGKERITWDCTRESFLFAPNEFRKVLDENGIPIAGIEWQPYLPVVDKEITKELIYKYLVELRNQNLTIADSSVLRYNNKNFRFLKDTKHLEEQGVTLPDWFVENPVVSIDIDAIYNRGENKEADQEMDQAISNFKK